MSRESGAVRFSDPLRASGYYAVTLLSGEPAGRISTTSAGVAFFEATLSPRPGDAAPRPEPGEPPPGARFLFPAWEVEPASSARRFSCEVRALRAAALTAALDGLLRAVTAHAALADAAVEARAVRLAEPAAHPAPLVEVLARDLWDAGFPVTFGPSWTPAPGACAAVGIGGLEEVEAFLREHPAWRVVGHVPPWTAAGAEAALWGEVW